MNGNETQQLFTFLLMLWKVLERPPPFIPTAAQSFLNLWTCYTIKYNNTALKIKEEWVEPRQIHPVLFIPLITGISSAHCCWLRSITHTSQGLRDTDRQGRTPWQQDNLEEAYHSAMMLRCSSHSPLRQVFKLTFPLSSSIGVTGQNSLKMVIVQCPAQT